jgi:hypothetical protein
MCACGHEESVHDEKGCTICRAGNALGLEGCPKFRSRGRAGQRVTALNGHGPTPAYVHDPLIAALDAAVRALGHFRTELVRAKTSGITSRVSKSPSPQGNRGGDQGEDGRAIRQAARPVPDERAPLRGSQDHLPKGERAVLIAIAQRDNGATHAGIAVLTGYKETSRRTYIQALLAKEYIERRDERFIATPKGLQALGLFDRLPVGEALIQYWLSKLPEGEATVFNAVLTSSHDLSRTDLEEMTGYKETSVRTYTQRLAARELLVVKHGTISLSPELPS